MRVFDEQKFDVYRSYLIANAKLSTLFEMPILEGVDYKPNRAVPFDKIRNTMNFDQWVHFYIEDRKFECLWRNPKQYLGLLKKFNGVLTPDYSIYHNMPLPMQIWNAYRNRAIAFWLQNNGIKIVPNIRWGKEATYGFAFEGIRQGGTVAVGTSGCLRYNIDKFYFKKGLREMVKTIRPAAIVCYSRMPVDVFGFCNDAGIELINIQNYRDSIADRGIA